MIPLIGAALCSLAWVPLWPMLKDAPRVIPPRVLLDTPDMTMDWRGLV